MLSIKKYLVQEINEVNKDINVQIKDINTKIERLQINMSELYKKLKSIKIRNNGIFSKKEKSNEFNIVHLGNTGNLSPIKRISMLPQKNSINENNNQTIEKQIQKIQETIGKLEKEKKILVNNYNYQVINNLQVQKKQQIKQIDLDINNYVLSNFDRNYAEGLIACCTNLGILTEQFNIQKNLEEQFYLQIQRIYALNEIKEPIKKHTAIMKDIEKTISKIEDEEKKEKWEKDFSTFKEVLKNHLIAISHKLDEEYKKDNPNYVYVNIDKLIIEISDYFENLKKQINELEQSNSNETSRAITSRKL
ncbi:MAG: hypothetical protein LEGION0398_MBIBDBAK_01340 [Legionellaceae bacterium]